jgi:hypothetical protein
MLAFLEATSRSNNTDRLSCGICAYLPYANEECSRGADAAGHEVAYTITAGKRKRKKKREEGKKGHITCRGTPFFAHMHVYRRRYAHLQSI